MIFPGGPRTIAALHFFSALKESRVVLDAPIDSIWPSQPLISWLKVGELMKSIRAEGLHNPPPCVKVGEDFYLVDGHHRTAAQIALGYKTIKVRAVEVSPEEWEAEIQRLKEKG